MVRLKVSIKGLMVLIALIAVGTACVRQMYFVGTVYSVDYNERRFGRIRVGMTTAEVESLVGQPLRKVPQLYAVPVVVNWMYTDGRPGWSNYWLREVFVQEGKVVWVGKMYWID